MKRIIAIALIALFSLFGLQAVAQTTTPTVAAAPTCTIAASPDVVVQGNSTVLNWATTNANAFSIDLGSGPVNVNGPLLVFPSNTTTYFGTAIGPGGSADCAVVVTVNSTQFEAFISRWMSAWIANWTVDISELRDVLSTGQRMQLPQSSEILSITSTERNGNTITARGTVVGSNGSWVTIFHYPSEKKTEVYISMPAFFGDSTYSLDGRMKFFFSPDGYQYGIMEATFHDGSWQIQRDKIYFHGNANMFPPGPRG